METEVTGHFKAARDKAVRSAPMPVVVGLHAAPPAARYKSTLGP